MKYSFVALAATSIFGGALAVGHGHHHHHRRNVPSPYGGSEECVPPEVPAPCTTIVTSYLVPVENHYPTHPVEVKPEPTTTCTNTVSTTVEAVYTSTTVVEIPHGVVPTPEITTCPTPGTYTIPEKTMTLTSTEYLCGKYSTELPPGIHTVGGVTTVVDTQTTVVCPVAVTEDVYGTVTSKVVMTTYVCPTPGTYTIAPITMTITQTDKVPCDYPTVTSYEPGVYTRPEEVITITKTNEVYVCPTYEHVDVTQTVVPVPDVTYTPHHDVPYSHPPVLETPPVQEYPVKVEETTPVKEYPVKETPVPSPVPSVKTPVDLPHGSSGPAWGITYSPYNDDKTCKTKEQITDDIKSISNVGFKTIRLYSSDCGSLDSVIPACKTYNMKIILGIFIRDTSCRADGDMKTIIDHAPWNLVEMFVVGNEAIFQGYCQAPQLAGYIGEIKKTLKDNGYTGPVTTTEPLNIIEQHYEALCSALDVVAINCHPYFNPDVTADQAGPFLNTQLKRAEDLCGKTGYVLEAGWPNAGNTNGKAVASPEAQQIAFKSLLSTCPTERICLFTWRNDKWKNPGGFNVEQNFGCGNLFQ